MKPLLFPKNVRIPSGMTATQREMKEYGQVIQTFINETKANISHEAGSQRHCETLDYLNHIAMHYNRELDLFNKTQQKRRVPQPRRLMQMPRF